MHRQSVATIVTQPKSVQTISSIQFESKSNASVQALIHPGPNHVHPCCEERRIFPLSSTLVANEPCLETRANHLESDVRLFIKYFIQTHDKVFTPYRCTEMYSVHPIFRNIATNLVNVKILILKIASKNSPKSNQQFFPPFLCIKL